MSSQSPYLAAGRAREVMRQPGIPISLEPVPGAVTVSELIVRFSERTDGGDRDGRVEGGGARSTARPPDLAGGDRGLAALLGDIAVSIGADAILEATGVWRLALSGSAAEWVTDRLLLWWILGGVPSAGSPALHRVDSSDLIRPVTEDGSAWRCRVVDGESIVAGWVASAEPDSRAAMEAGFTAMTTVLAAALGGRRLRFQIDAQPAAAVASGTPMVRLGTGLWTAWWPEETVRRLIAVIAGDDGATSRAAGGAQVHLVRQMRAAMKLLDAGLRMWGLRGVIARLPRSAAERRSRLAVQVIGELIEAGGIVPRVLGDAAFRSGAHYQALVDVLRSLPATEEQTALRAIPRRAREALEDRLAGSPDRSPLLPWERAGTAARLLADAIASRVKEGLVSPAATAIVRERYSEPRTSRLRGIWRQSIDRGELSGIVTSLPTPARRSVVRLVPRADLLLAACGERDEVIDALGAGWSRRGRRLFADDVTALTGRVERREFDDWEMILASRARVAGLLARIAKRIRERKAGNSVTATWRSVSIGRADAAPDPDAATGRFRFRRSPIPARA